MQRSPVNCESSARETIILIILITQNGITKLYESNFLFFWPFLSSIYAQDGTDNSKATHGGEAAKSSFPIYVVLFVLRNGQRS